MANHMTPDEFRRHGYAVVDWIADYWSTLDQRPVTPGDPPGAVAARLPAEQPERGEAFDRIIADLDSVIAPGITHWQHPRFFGYFPANTSGPSVLGDLVCAGLGVQGMLWSTGPACTEVETVVLDWLADLLDLPARFRSTGPGGGVIQDSASTAILIAILAALHRASGGRWRGHGVDRRYRVYTSTEGHSAIEKAVRIAGLGDAGLRTVGVDPGTRALDPAALRAAFEADREAGLIPVAVVATIGTTSTNAIDPVPAIGELCRKYGVWLHVDAAYAGAAAVCPELRWSHAGLEFADSYCFDPHKWLLTGFDCDAFWVADRTELIEALTVLPEYLRNVATESGAVLDYRDWQVSLGRRFRALKLWFVLRWYGVEGLRAHIRSGVALADQFAGWVTADPRFDLVAAHPFALVCFRLRSAVTPADQAAPVDAAAPADDDAPDDADEVNAELLARVNASGRAYLTHTRVAGRYTLRLAIGSPYTREEHVVQTWRLIGEIASALPDRRS